MERDLNGGKKTTCKEAARLLNEGKATKAYFRPNGPDRPPFADDDEAFVWMK